MLYSDFVLDSILYLDSEGNSPILDMSIENIGNMGLSMKIRMCVWPEEGRKDEREAGPTAITLSIKPPSIAL